jgi:hypothetical protein
MCCMPLLLGAPNIAGMKIPHGKGSSWPDALIALDILKQEAHANNKTSRLCLVIASSLHFYTSARLIHFFAAVIRLFQFSG